MQQDNGNNAGQQPLQNTGGVPMTAAQQAQYRATLLQQQQMQMQAQARLPPQQRNTGVNLQQQQQQHQQGRPMPSQQQMQQQQQSQQGGQPRPPQQNVANPAATQAQMQALQQLFQNNPEQWAALLNMSKEGKFTAEQMSQVRRWHIEMIRS